MGVTTDIFEKALVCMVHEKLQEQDTFECEIRNIKYGRIY